MAATVLFLIYIPIAIGAARAKGGASGGELGLAFLLGIALDTTIQIGGRTLDLSWQTGLIAPLIVIVLALSLVQTLRLTLPDVKQAADGNWLSNLAVFAIGPWIFLQLLIFQNTAWSSSVTGWSTPYAGLLLLAGDVLALYLSAQAESPRRSWINIVLVGAIAFISLYMLFNEFTLSPLWLLLGQVFSMTLGMFIFLGATRFNGKRGLLRTTILNGMGHIVLVLFVFVYYASYDIAFGFRSGILPPIALVLSTVLIALAYLAKHEEKQTPRRNYSPAYLSICFLVVPLVLLTTWKTPKTRPAPEGTSSLRIMDYNLHDGVNTDGGLDPEGLAQAMQASRADIIGVQEISRGWLTWGGLDMLEWLSQRLDLPYIWQATADSQWGIAIFSRYPILNVENYDLPPEDIQLLRGFVVAQIDVDGKIVNIINTHYSEKDDQDEIRTVQSSAILSTWNHATATVLMGDLNSLPDSDAVRLILEAGFTDISREIGKKPTFTYYSAKPDHQIDYIFVTPDLSYSDFEIPRTTASDHLPVETTVGLP